MVGKKTKTKSEPKGSISTLLHSKQAATSNKSFSTLFDVTKPHEVKINDLWIQHGDVLNSFTKTRFQIGEITSLIVRAVRNAKFPGGFKAFHTLRNIPVPRQTCTRYAALYQDVASLNLKDEVLNAAFAAGIDLIKQVSKIKTAKTEVQNMNGPQFVAFLRQKPTRIQRPKPETVADFVDAGIIALDKVFEGISDEEQKNQAYAGIAYQIRALADEAKFTGGEFTVKSPISNDEMEELFNRVT